MDVGIMQFISHSLSGSGSSQPRFLILCSHDQTVIFSHSIHHCQVFIRGRRGMRCFTLSKTMSHEEQDLNLSSQNTKKGRVIIDADIIDAGIYIYTCN